MAEMRPGDVPADYVEAAADTIHAHYAANPDDESEENAIRILLATILPLHEKQMRERAEKAERELAELRERYDVLGHNRMEIAIELGAAGRWHPDNATWSQDMHQAARIAEIGLDGYAAENGLQRIGGFIRDDGKRKAADHG